MNVQRKKTVIKDTLQHILIVLMMTLVVIPFRPAPTIAARGDPALTNLSYIPDRTATSENNDNYSSYSVASARDVTRGLTPDNRATIQGLIAAQYQVTWQVQNAVYLLTPGSLFYNQVTKLTAADGAAYDEFGYPVSISGDTVVIGAFHKDYFTGSSYVFERNQGGTNAWGQVAKLTAADSDDFGISVSISGDTVIVGADEGVGGRGAAYVFERNQGGTNAWGQVTKLTAADAGDGDQFGISVSISGDTIVIGACGDDGGPYSGSAYVFERSQGGADNWGQVAKLTAADGTAGDYFGYAVAIDGDTVVVGAWGDSNDGGGSYSGSSYVFERNQGGTNAWGQVAKLTAADAASNDYFGEAVSISGDTVVVGAWGDGLSGSAYVFERNQGGADNWGQVVKLTADYGGYSSGFGRVVSIRGDTAVVGSYGDDGSTGAAYIFERNEGGADNWGQVARLIAADGAYDDEFGSAVSISGDTVVVGAHMDDDIGTSSGSAYIFQGQSLSSITGRVLDSDGNPLASVQITANNIYSDTTDAEGYYNIAGVPAGTYTLVPAAGTFWSPSSRTVTVPPDAEEQDFVGRNVHKTVASSSPQTVGYGDSLTYTVRFAFPENRTLVLYDRVPAHTMYISDSLNGPAGVVYDPISEVISGTLTLTATVPETVTFSVQVGITGTLGSAPIIVNRACIHPVGGGLEDCTWSNEVWRFTYVWPIYLPLIGRSF